MSDILSMSKTGKSEYCCSVVRIGELIPIEGSDFLAKTNIQGTQIVVRKDQVTTGTIMFYAENETALNEKFLSVNNLFEIGCREKNSNAAEVDAIMTEYDEKYRNQADELRAKAKGIKSKINSLTSSASKHNNKIKNLQKELNDINSGKVTLEDGHLDAINEEIKIRKGKVDNATSMSMKLTVDYTNLKNQIEELVKAGQPIIDKAKTLVGFFNKYGRVRCITLKGEPSFGFVFGIDEMAKYCPEINDINLEEYINQDFDTVNGEIFVKAFVPPVKPRSERNCRGEKRNKKLSRFDRLIEGEFAYHYDTQQLNKNIHKFTPDTNVFASLKIHGTSSIIGKLHVKEPKRIAPLKWLWNKIVESTGWFKNTRFIDYNIVYGPVYSSRTVIKNKYINNDVNSGFYSKDIWTEYGDIIYPYLEEGMTVYGEIFGYITGSQQMIQKNYDYGCQEGENKIMFYRISTINEDGTKREWEVDEVRDWTIKLIERMTHKDDPNYKRIHPIDILYHGTFGDLYPEIDPEEHWHEEVLNKIKTDKEHFGMEELEPICKNQVPREGIVIRISQDPISQAFKSKSQSFLFKEAVLMDSGEVDIEMLDNYGDIVQEEEITDDNN